MQLIIVQKKNQCFWKFSEELSFERQREQIYLLERIVFVCELIGIKSARCENYIDISTGFELSTSFT